MKEKTRVIQHGLGTTGSAMAKLMLEKSESALVGAIDIAGEKAGKDLGEIVGLGKKVGITVSKDPDVVFAKVKADIVLNATVSFMPEIWSQIIKPVEAGMNVITIGEEMSYPYAKYPELAKEIDEKAKKYGVTILGTGVNPGFAMDFLVLALCSLCHSIRKIRVTRLVDFSPYPASVLQLLGVGFNADEFNQGKAKGSIYTFIGLRESMSMVADGLGWKLDEMKETVEPVISEKHIETPMKIEPGKAYGFDQRCRGIKDGEDVIILEELGRVGPGLEPKNTISIEGIPDIIETMSVPPSNLTASGHAVNLIPHVISAQPGLVTMKDLPLAASYQLGQGEILC